MAENETPNESTDEPIELEVVEIVEVVEVIEEPLADTAAVDAAIARASEPVELPAEPEAVTVTETAVIEDVIPTEAPAVPAAPATPSWGAETVAPAPGFTPDAAQTVYVQAPLPPKVKSNRGFSTLVALIGTALFTGIYAGVTYIFLSIAGAARYFGDFLESPIFWGAAALFFVAYALLGIIINRGPYWVQAVFSLFVGVIVYFGVVGLTLVAVQAWTMSAAEVSELLRQNWMSPYAIIAAIIAREIPIWFGGWIARNGRKVTAKNEAALDAYEREVAAGPVFQ